MYNFVRTTALLFFITQSFILYGTTFSEAVCKALQNYATKRPEVQQALKRNNYPITYDQQDPSKLVQEAIARGPERKKLLQKRQNPPDENFTAKVNILRQLARYPANKKVLPTVLIPMTKDFKVPFDLNDLLLNLVPPPEEESPSQVRGVALFMGK